MTKTNPPHLLAPPRPGVSVNRRPAVGASIPESIERAQTRAPQGFPPLGWAVSIFPIPGVRRLLDSIPEIVTPESTQV